MEQQILWFIVTTTSLFIASDWAKLTNILKFKFAPYLAIIAAGLTTPFMLKTIGLPIWLTFLPCHIAMMLSIVMFPTKKATED